MTDFIAQYRTKSPDESLLYDFEFKDKLGSGVTLSGSEAVTQVSKAGRVTGSSNLTISAVNRSGTIVQCRLAAGTADEDYLIQAKCADSQGNTLSIEVVFQVRYPKYEE